MRIAALAGAAAALALGGCAGGFGGAPGLAPGGELVGRTIAVEARGGQRSTLHFRPNGSVQAAFGGRKTDGRWWVAERRLCFQWGGSWTECWPYRRPFRVGEPNRITSDRGNDVTATLL